MYPEKYRTSHGLLAWFVVLVPGVISDLFILVYYKTVYVNTWEVSIHCLSLKGRVIFQACVFWAAFLSNTVKEE